MKEKNRHIFLAILTIFVVIIGFLVLTMVALCLTTCFSHYVRQFVFAMNDEAVPDDDDDEAAAERRRRQGSAAAAGLDKAAIDKLPIVVYEMKGVQEENGGHGDVDCGVCLADFGEKERVRLLPWCQHCFHPDCIDTWLSLHSTCPLCRRSPPLPFTIIDLGSPTIGRA